MSISYAIDYHKVYYIGRVLECNKENTKFKFLHKKRMESGKYEWPIRDDIDVVKNIFVFAGPINLDGIVEFMVKEQAQIDAAHVEYKKWIQQVSHEFAPADK